MPVSDRFTWTTLQFTEAMSPSSAATLPQLFERMTCVGCEAEATPARQCGQCGQFVQGRVCARTYAWHCVRNGIVGTWRCGSSNSLSSRPDIRCRSTIAACASKKQLGAHCWRPPSASSSVVEQGSASVVEQGSATAACDCTAGCIPLPLVRLCLAACTHVSCLTAGSLCTFDRQLYLACLRSSLPCPRTLCCAAAFTPSKQTSPTGPLGCGGRSAQCAW
mmetsp:Transcript_25441/g.75178  ORF Transcript_25441/g.75178 Transcript_25441/m.75178 type:complete len:220 (+) Transcript_25441:1609-2268(+)